MISFLTILLSDVENTVWQKPVHKSTAVGWCLLISNDFGLSKKETFVHLKCIYKIAG